jgi:hypothetical protein
MALVLVPALVLALLAHRLPRQMVQSHLQQLVSTGHPGTQHQPSRHARLFVVFFYVALL